MRGFPHPVRPGIYRWVRFGTGRRRLLRAYSYVVRARSWARFDVGGRRRGAAGGWCRRRAVAGARSPRPTGRCSASSVASGPKEAPYQPLADLEGKLGRRVAVDRYDRPFGTAFPDGREQADVAAGRIPMIAWGPVATGEVNRGSWDAQIRLRARGIRGLGQPVLHQLVRRHGQPRQRAPWPATPASTPPPGAASAGSSTRRRPGTPSGSGAPAPPTSPPARPTPGTPATTPSTGPAPTATTPATRPGPTASRRSFEEIFAPFHDWGVRPRQADDGRPLRQRSRTGPATSRPGSTPPARRSRARCRGSTPSSTTRRSRRPRRPRRPATTGAWTAPTSRMAAFAAMGDDPWFKPAVETTLPDTVIDSGPEKTVAAARRHLRLLQRRSGQGHAASSATSTGAGGSPARRPTPSPACPTAGTASRSGRSARAAGPTRRRPGGSGSSTPPAPSVTATTPKDGATNASPGTELTATFSEAVDPATVVAETFVARGRGDRAGGDREGDLRPGHPQGPAPARRRPCCRWPPTGPRSPPG